MNDLVARLRAAGCVFAEDEARLLREAADGVELGRLVARRMSGEPLEHLLGWVEFDGLRLHVEPGVFVPRRRTELLVREAVALVADQPDPLVVDLCCGCGAVGVAVLRRFRSSRPERGRLIAADVDRAAVRCAARNVERLGGTVLLGDLFDALPENLRGRVDLLLANVPYVPTGAIPLMPPEARDHEPRTALDGGYDGLALLARVAATARDWLSDGGSVLMETSAEQASRGLQHLAAGGLTPRVVSDEEMGGTVVIGDRRDRTRDRGRRPPG